MNSELTDSRITFHDLFSRFDRIEIPIIQRDYAQGRSAAEDVRTGLLEAFKNALEKETNDVSLPLDLDFVYGTIEEQGKERWKVFLPLDGQQRLTTLFLLHWYSAWRDGESEVFKATFTRDGKSIFSYSVRPSSTEFFDSLSQWFPEESDEDFAPSELLQEQPWFFLYWKQDPTIQSALVMLDSMHGIFSDSSGVYEKLCDSTSPHITFQLLELEQFGLSDDLYIKMNARGKPLTVFENFKARVEQHLSSTFPTWKEQQGGNLVSIKNYFSHKIETSWADLFWHYRDKDLNLFDDQIMGLFRVLATITRDPEAEVFEDIWQDIRDPEKPLTFQRCQKLGCTDEVLFRTFFSLLDKLEGGRDGIVIFLDDDKYFDEARIFEKAINRRAALTYEELIQFHAYAGFLLRQKGEVDGQALGEWMRVVSNLAQNTIYNRLDDYQRSMRALNPLFEDCGSILSFLGSTDDPVSGFNEQQVREEKLKAQLIQKSSEWRELIFRAEQHGYFAGQIEFLFKFSGILDQWLSNGLVNWDDAADIAFRKNFSLYFERAESVFDDKGLRVFEDALWERALLTEGDYLLSSGRNYCLLGTEKRELSWKRLLRGNPKNMEDEERRLFVKALFDKIDPKKHASDCLREVVEGAKLEDMDSWRRILVEEPEMISYCEKRMMRWNGDECIYLMRKIQMNGEHAELFSYHLFVSKLKSGVEVGGLAPLQNCRYRSVTDSETEPSILMDAKSEAGVIEIGVSTRPGDDPLMDVWIQMSEGEIPENVSALLLKEGEFRMDGEPEDSWLEKTVPRGDVEAELNQLAQLLKNHGICKEGAS